MKENSNAFNGFKYLIISVIFSVAGVFVPEFLLITGTMALAFNIVAFCLLPFYATFLPAVITFVFAILSGQNLYMAALFTGIFLPAALGISICIKQKKQMIETFVTGLILISVWMLTILGAFIFFRGGELSVNGLKTAFSPFIDQFNSLTASTIELYKELNPALGARMETLIIDYKEVIGTYLAKFLPSLIISMAAFIVFFGLLIAKRSLYKNGVDVSSLKRFRHFKLPKSAAILFVVCLLGQLFLSGTMETAFSNLYSVLTTLFLLSGFSFFSFLMNRTEIAKPAIKVIFIFLILLCILPLGFSVIISGAGVLDSLSDFRTKLIKRKGE